MNLIETSGMLFYQFEHLSRFSGVRHLVSTRVGGVGESDFNISLRHGDPQAALANRKQICDYLQILPQNLILPEQVHANRVAIVTPKEHGMGAQSHQNTVQDVDALISASPGTPLMALAADCPLLAFWEPQRRIIAVAHAGWRGTVGEIAIAVVELMKATFGIKATEIYAYISPCIGPCCYQVGEEVIQKISRLKNGPQFLVRRQDKWYCDLQEANRNQLQRTGIKYVEVANLCTRCHNQHFYSYRAEGENAGRFGLIITTEGQVV